MPRARARAGARRRATASTADGRHVLRIAELSLELADGVPYARANGDDRPARGRAARARRPLPRPVRGLRRAAAAARAGALGVRSRAARADARRRRASRRRWSPCRPPVGPRAAGDQPPGRQGAPAAASSSTPGTAAPTTACAGRSARTGRSTRRTSRSRWRRSSPPRCATRGVDVIMTRTTDTLIALSRPRADRERAARRRLRLGARERGAARLEEARRHARATRRTSSPRRRPRTRAASSGWRTSRSTSRRAPRRSRGTRSTSSSTTWRRTSTCASRASSRRSCRSGSARRRPGPSRGVFQAGFRVLVTAYMPAVLVEIGFGTNRDEAKLLDNGSLPAAHRRVDRRRDDRVPEPLRAARERRGEAVRRSGRGTRRRRRRSRRAVTAHSALAVEAAGLRFQNPVLLASGTAAYGRELDGVIDLDAARRARDEGGEPAPARGRAGAARRRFPGRDDQRRRPRESRGSTRCGATSCPGSRRSSRRARVLVNVIGDTRGRVRRGGARPRRRRRAVHGFELNVSCPNVKAGGMEFGADPATLAAVVRGARAATTRAALREAEPDAPRHRRERARSASTPAPTRSRVVNTIPGLVVDVAARRPALGFGQGGVSGPGLLPVGVLAVWRVRKAVQVPVLRRRRRGERGGCAAVPRRRRDRSSRWARRRCATHARRSGSCAGSRSWCDREGVRSHRRRSSASLQWPVVKPRAIVALDVPDAARGGGARRRGSARPAIS